MLLLNGNRKFVPQFRFKGNLLIETEWKKNRWTVIPNIEPFIDENHTFIGVIGVYSKNGKIPKCTKSFIRKYKKRFKFIWLSSSGPYFEKNYKRLYRYYDGVTSLDCTRNEISLYKNNLELSYSMYTRCAPRTDGFFWNPSSQFDVDFSILTWFGDDKSKVWKDALAMTIGLCSRGYKGVVVNQRGGCKDLLYSGLRKYVDGGFLKIYEARFDEIEFHEIMSRARVGIFPNQSDAFPKHIIECLLSDKSIVISPNLLFGVNTLRELGSEITLVQDFSDSDAVDKVGDFIDCCYNRTVSSRNLWLKRFDFYNISTIWAKKINGLFGTNYKRVLLMRHSDRFAKYLE